MIQPLVCHQFRRSSKTNRGADDMKTLTLIFRPHLSTFSFSSQQPWHTSRCLSLLPPSLAVMLLWLHSKGYAVYPPSLPVTPLPPPVTHTHTLAPPQSPALSTIYRPHNHDTYSLPLHKGLIRWVEEVKIPQWVKLNVEKKMEICTVPTPSALVKALIINMLFDSTLPPQSSEASPPCRLSLSTWL